jgi:hypothetical protein
MKISSVPTVASGGRIRIESSSNPGAPTRASARVLHRNGRFGQRSASWQDEFSAIRRSGSSSSPPASLRLLELLLQPCFPRNTISKRFKRTCDVSIFWPRLRPAKASTIKRKASQSVARIRFSAHQRCPGTSAAAFASVAEIRC